MYVQLFSEILYARTFFISWKVGMLKVVCFAAYIWQDGDIWNHDLPGGTKLLVNRWACAKECHAKTPDCVRFVWFSDNNECALKKATGTVHDHVVTPRRSLGYAAVGNLYSFLYFPVLPILRVKEEHSECNEAIRDGRLFIFFRLCSWELRPIRLIW